MPETVWHCNLDSLGLALCDWLCMGCKLRSLEQPSFQVKKHLLMTSDDRRTCEGSIETNHWPIKGLHKKGHQPQDPKRSQTCMARGKQCNIVQPLQLLQPKVPIPLRPAIEKGSSSRPAKRDVLWLWWPTSRLKLSIGMSYEFFLPACPRIGSSSSSKFPWWTFENWFGTIFTWNHNFACKCPVFTLCHGPYKLHEEVALSSFRTPRESLWIRIGSLGKRLGNEIHCSSKSVGNSLRLASFYNSEFIASSNAAGVDSSNASPSSQTASYT